MPSENNIIGSKSDPSIAIIIPTHNRYTTLNKLLLQLSRQKKSHYTFELIVVADSTDQEFIQKIAKEHPVVHIIKGTGHWWFTRSVNEGIKKAQTTKVSHVLILNDDCEINEDYLAKITQCISAQPNSIIGSACFDNQLRDVVIFAGVKEIKWYRYKHELYFEKFTNVDLNSFSGMHISKALYGRGMLIPISIVNTIGYYDEKMVQYTSDYEYCYRALKANIPIYISWDAKVFDNISLTGKSMPHIKKSILYFIRSFWDKRSNNYLPTLIRVIQRNVPLLLRIPVLCIALIGKIRSDFFKYRGKKVTLEK